jgi:uncharacterized membrane protein
VGIGFLFLVTKWMLTSGVYIPYVSPLAGIAVALGIPVFLIYVADVTRSHFRAERLGMSVVLTLGLIMAAGLAVNTVLPLLGVVHPLSSVPATDTVEGLIVILALIFYRRHPTVYRGTFPSLGWRDLVLAAMAIVVPVLAVAGAVRLNNGGSGAVTLGMLALALVTFWLLLSWRLKIHRGLIPFAIYSISLGLLLMTSIRGWYTTGHDVQTEYLVFQLTKTLGRWRISRFPDAYNACLSITILPMMIWRWTRIADPYVYKVVFQFLFAFCPVLVYRLAHRATSVAIALLATIFFVSFVTFFQDMPSLNRQEIGFLFFVCALLVLFNTRLTIRARRIWFGLFGMGMVVSHYSTTYVAIGVLLIALGIRVALGVLRPALDRVAPEFAKRMGAFTVRSRGKYVLSLGMIVFLVLIAFSWSAPLTHTQQGLSKTLRQSIKSLRWDAIVGSKSSDTSYSIFAPSKTSPAKRLKEFQDTTLAQTVKGRELGAYFDLETVSAYPVSVAGDTALPLTSAGRTLRRAGLNVASFNYQVRQTSARLLQVFILIGLGAVAIARRKRIHPPPELFCLAAAALVVVILQVLLPPLSVNYGVLRAFQQGLVLLDVFLVAGILALIPRFARRWNVLVCGVLALIFFASATGVFTQVLGGYGPQMHLNNAGAYYDTYYTHPEEVAAIHWLSNHPVPGARRQPAVQMDPFTYQRMRNFTHMTIVPDIYPLVVQRSTYVFLGYANVKNSTASEPVNGDIIAYRYPMKFLDSTKDLIYSSGADRVYK